MKTPHELWIESGEDPERYVQLMKDAGHILGTWRDRRASSPPPLPEPEEPTPVEVPPPVLERRGQLVTTTDGKAPAAGLENAAAPQPVGPDGQHGAYWVLTADERAKGFVRPVRCSYAHVGMPEPVGLVDLTPEELERYASFGYVKFQPYPESEHPVKGRYWTAAQLGRVGKGCGAITTMGSAIAETYARSPTFYGATFCATCSLHLPVGKDGEFVWVDKGLITDERVGT